MFNYVPTESGMKLHECNSYLKMIIGPYGSGKSCACAVDVLACACAQNPAPDGIRYSRVGIVRSSYPELESSTRRSLLEILPREYGHIAASGSPMKGIYVIPLPDGTTVQLELELWALKGQEAYDKLRSANWSFAWINEATGCTPDVYNAVTGRVGRFPPQSLGGVTWGGTMMDFNMPTPGSWLDTYIKHPEKNWSVIWQPPAAFKREDEHGKTYYEINPDAENLHNLGSFEEGDPPDLSDQEKGMRFYRNQIDAQLKLGRFDIIDNQYCMLDVPIVEGKPVYPAFSMSLHVSRHTLTPIRGTDIIVGMDQSGIHPAAVVMQWQSGKWCVLDEIYAENEGFENFLHGMLLPLLREKYAECPTIAAIDPSNQRDSWQGITPRERLEEIGLRVAPFCSNNPRTRIYAVEKMLNQVHGGLLVSSACELLIRGFTHEYRYRRMKVSGTIGAVYTPTPEKNDASHVHDALQYAVMYITSAQDLDEHAVQSAAEKLMSRRHIRASIVLHGFVFLVGVGHERTDDNHKLDDRD